MQPLVTPKEICRLLSGAKTARVTEKGLQAMITPFGVSWLRETFVKDRFRRCRVVRCSLSSAYENVKAPPAPFRAANAVVPRLTRRQYEAMRSCFRLRHNFRCMLAPATLSTRAHGRNAKPVALAAR